MTLVDLVWFYVCRAGEQGFSWKKQAEVLCQKLQQQLRFSNTLPPLLCYEYLPEERKGFLSSESQMH